MSANNAPFTTQPTSIQNTVKQPTVEPLNQQPASVQQLAAGQPMGPTATQGLPIVQQPLGRSSPQGQPLVQQPGPSYYEKYGHGQPITQQPGPADIAYYDKYSPPGTPKLSAPLPAGFPRGLDYLHNVNHLKIDQKVDLWEIQCGCEMENEYEVKNHLGQQQFDAKEDTDFCNRYFCGYIRSFDIHIKDLLGVEVLTLSRGLNCQGPFCCCCLQELDVRSPFAGHLGSIKEDWTCWDKSFTVKDAAGVPILKIHGPCLTCSSPCCGKSNVEFNILTLDESTRVNRNQCNYNKHLNTVMFFK